MSEKSANQNEQKRNVIVGKIAQIFAVEEKEVVENASFIEDLNGDSLDVYETIFALEDEFEVETSIDAPEPKTVKEMIELFTAR